MRIWDISQTLSAETPVWPGEPPVALRRHATIGADCPVTVGAIATPLHAGTHADAPLHYDPDGADSAACDLAAYIGPCLVVDASHAGERVEEADLDWPALAGAERVLLRTYRAFAHDAWDSQFTAVAGAVVARLRGMGVRLIGVDAASLDPETSKAMEAHREVLAGDMRILEGLVLDHVPPGCYELIALPLRIAGADASPVRAILREIV